MNSWTPDERGIVRLWQPHNARYPNHLMHNRFVTVSTRESDIVAHYQQRYTFNRFDTGKPSFDASYRSDSYARFQFEAEQECRLELGLPLLRDADAEQREEWHRQFMAELEADERAARRRGWKSAAQEDDFLEVLEFEELCERSLER